MVDADPAMGDAEPSMPDDAPDAAPDAAAVECAGEPTVEIRVDGMPLCAGRLTFAGEAGASDPSPRWGALFLAECDGYRLTSALYLRDGLPPALPADIEPEGVALDLFGPSGFEGSGGRGVDEDPDAPTAFAPLVGASLSIASPTCLSGEIETFIARSADPDAERRRVEVTFSGWFRAL